KLIKCLQDLNKATSFKSGKGTSGGLPRDEVKDDPWFVPMLESELSGDDLKQAFAAISATRAPGVGIRDTLLSAIDHRDIAQIRTLLADPALVASEHERLKNDPVLITRMGKKLHQAALCETSLLLKYGSAGIPTVAARLLGFFQKDPVDQAGAVSFLKALAKA